MPGIELPVKDDLLQVKFYPEYEAVAAPLPPVLGNDDGVRVET